MFLFLCIRHNMLKQNLISAYFILLKVFHVWFSHFQNFSSFLAFFLSDTISAELMWFSKLFWLKEKSFQRFSDHFSLGTGENPILVFMCFLESWKIQPMVCCRSVLQMQEITVKPLIWVARSLKPSVLHMFLDIMWTIKLFFFWGSMIV